MRFHALFRELLEAELGWRDPRRRVELHRRAADVWRDRGDLNAAYRHLAAIGALDDARDLVVQPAMDLVDRGDHVGLARFMRSMPKALHVDDAHLALDLAVAWFFAGHGAEAERWCDRADELGGHEPGVELRLHTTRCMAALMRGELGQAREHVDRYVELTKEVSSSNPIDQRFATTAARVALASGDLTAAARWVAEAREIEGPSTVAEVTVPALEGWYELSAGRLERALALAVPASERAIDRGVRPHHGAFDALVVAGWCQVAAGRLAEAAELAEAAQTDADALGFVWNRVRAGALVAEVRRLTVGPLAALAQVRDLRASIGVTDHPPLLAVLGRVEALALLAAGRTADAAASIDRVPGAGAQLVGAYVTWREPRPVTARELDDLLGDRRSWSRPDHLGAEILLGAADVSPAGDARLRTALDEAVATGWRWPFLGLPHDVAGRVRAVAVEHRHADVLRLMDGPSATTRRSTGPSEPLTMRELTVLELLPTHLSYAQIGERLFVSVNTVKTNLKSIYRKLGVSSRSEAVAVARESALL
jgi:LuxR family maltose regulon positive regulatory protein